MAKRRDYITLAQVLGAGALPWRVASRLPGPALLTAWRETAGPALAARARPVCLQEDGTLVVAVKGAVWRQELQMLAPEILPRLQELGQAVARIRLVNARAQAEPPPQPPPPPPITPEQEEAIAARFAGIKDPGPRAALVSLMRAQMQAQGSGPEE
jgi:hypothetical protein